MDEQRRDARLLHQRGGLDGQRIVADAARRAADQLGRRLRAQVQAALDGTWKPDSVWLGIKDDVVKLAPFTNMPDDVKKLAEETEAKIRSGELHPFTGPVKKQDGSEWLKAGESSDDPTLLGMNFYVEGVDDKLPK